LEKNRVDRKREEKSRVEQIRADWRRFRYRLTNTLPGKCKIEQITAVLNRINRLEERI
jgi:hypothetical protein